MYTASQWFNPSTLAHLVLLWVQLVLGSLWIPEDPAHPEVREILWVRQVRGSQEARDLLAVLRCLVVRVDLYHLVVLVVLRFLDFLLCLVLLVDLY